MQIRKGNEGRASHAADSSYGRRRSGSKALTNDPPFEPRPWAFATQCPTSRRGSPDFGPRFATVMGIGGGRADLFVRFGRGPVMPKSLRRELQSVLD